MTTDVDICNQALDEAMVRATIGSILEQSKEGKACNRHYTSVRDSLLRAVRWNFARKQVALTLLRDATQSQVVPTPWVYEYAYPADCLKARFILPLFDALPGTVGSVSAAPVWQGPPIHFVESSDSIDGKGNDIKVILTNQNQAILVYTKRITDPNMFDSSFEELFRASLAAKLIAALVGDRKKYDAQVEVAKKMFDEAASTNGNEGLPMQNHTPDWIRARGYLSDWATPDFYSLGFGPGMAGQID